MSRKYRLPVALALLAAACDVPSAPPAPAPPPPPPLTAAQAQALRSCLYSFQPAQHAVSVTMCVQGAQP